ncbi:MucR family transcriptional regulator [Pseudonocardia sp. C8]|uniref:MucR family transcriptional regulator n=1 Tax=Pseudonocardia sp. C8 TaxID=2762759 RepID=UPI0016427A34|nr:MucR family transcriptional regulator [Pseudonocardia sp. C8]MBC3194829.1 MucR family transcriptional regulator [Pseudonocardia sp. C8]
MLDPVGPLPASVYWRRRAVAVGLALLALAAGPWLAAWLLAPGDSDVPTDPAAQSTPDIRAAAPPPAAPAPPAPGPAHAPLPTPAGPGAPPGTTGASPGPAAPNAGPGDETVRPDDTPRPSVPVPEGAPSPPTGPVPCSDGMIEVRAEAGQPAYPPGARPELRLVVTNTSGQPCVRDLDGTEQEIAVWSGDGARKLWSSNDCANPATDDLRTLVPGQPVAFAVTWSGLASEPGCGAERERVAAGGYRVLARLGAVVSEPVPLLMG